MPVGVVKTRREEHLWNKAKSQARKEYPNIKEGSTEWWKRVMGIFKNMKGD